MTISKIKLVVSVLVAGVMAPASAYAQAKTVTLDDAVDLGLRVHPSIVQARGQVRNATWSKRTAIGSWLPSLSFSSGWSQNSSTRFDAGTQRNVSGSSTSYSAAFSSSIELFDGFRRINQNKAANATAMTADAAYVNQEFQVVLQIKQTFFSALAADQLVGVSETRIDRAQEQLQITRDVDELDLSADEEGHPVAKLVGHRHVVGGQKDRASRILLLTDQPLDAA